MLEAGATLDNACIIYSIMVNFVSGDKTCPAIEGRDVKVGGRSARLAYLLGALGIILMLLMFAAIFYYKDDIAQLTHYGYLGAFIISILGSATIIIPVPMLAVVFALGGIMASPWSAALLALSAACGELIGSLTIYMTGHGAGRAIAGSKHGRLQSAYERMLGLMERRGPVVLFAVASVINPFFYPAALACGALRLNLRKFALIVFAGKMIKAMTVVYAGYFGLKGLFHIFGIDL
jgi:membrane protein YqaA with SNARE-associated domain